MPVHRTKNTTPPPPDSTQEQTAPALPDQQTFQQYLNAIESLFSNVRQRTDQIDLFTTETSCLTIVWATIQDIRFAQNHAHVKLQKHHSYKLSNQPQRVVQREVSFCALSGLFSPRITLLSDTR